MYVPAFKTSYSDTPVRCFGTSVGMDVSKNDLQILIPTVPYLDSTRLGMYRYAREDLIDLIDLIQFDIFSISLID